ncbi:4a-hydroxytetrahydrobiopterin dehydratase [Pararhodobacter aggregans]|uniref:4a-hydroxytetrahydrobiopterin dehydratase n=1 Tax=Pararhodobacter aggregans TaxID=404875 RepID=UPI003A93F4E8
MARPQVLAGAARDQALAELAAAGWAHDPATDRLSKSFRFKDFSAAWGWMSRVALKAEVLDHHPDWSNSWNKVDVSLTTHDQKGLTELDLALARAMDKVAG